MKQIVITLIVVFFGSLASSLVAAAIYNTFFDNGITICLQKDASGEGLDNLLRHQGVSWINY